ncbi:MAG: hypothetical protein HQK54_09890 [Oligoflexales bacterium]|nr:hypothetical protein [Oligoflexales bacterium]
MSDLNQFVAELERVIKIWPERAVWAISQLAMYTQMDASQVAKWVSSALGREMDIQDRLTFEQGEQILSTLHGYAESGDRLPSFTKEHLKGTEAFENMRKKLTPLLQSRDFRQAYKNLSFFMRHNGRNLAASERIEGAAECLRVGEKADIPASELASWLQNGVDASLEDKTERGIDDAIDLLDAYGHIFANNEKNSFLEELFKRIRFAAEPYDKDQIIDDIHEQVFRGEEE